MSELAERVAAHPGWYHTIDLPDGVETPGFADLRPFAPQALPDSLAGKRCLDVGTFDGFWAFSLEARGPEVVYALDLPDGTQADWPPNTREENLAASRETGLEWGSGFKLAHEALGSAVRRIEGNVYDLNPGWTEGPVDVLLCGTILQHLRDPTGALERMRETLKPGGTLLMIEAYSVPITRRHRNLAVAEYRPSVPGSQFTWWMPNIATLRGWATTAGFIETGVPIAKHKPVKNSGKGDHVCRLTFSAPG